MYYSIDRSDNTLEHGEWGKKATKYVKKKFINGKWRYYYKDATSKAKYAVNRVKEKIENAKKKIPKNPINKKPVNIDNIVNSITNNDTYNKAEKYLNRSGIVTGQYGHPKDDKGFTDIARTNEERKAMLTSRLNTWNKYLNEDMEAINKNGEIIYREKKKKKK